MARNEHAALRLAHPTVVPDGGESDDVTDDRAADAVDATGAHPTVRVADSRGG